MARICLSRAETLMLSFLAHLVTMRAHRGLRGLASEKVAGRSNRLRGSVRLHPISVPQYHHRSNPLCRLKKWKPGGLVSLNARLNLLGPNRPRMEHLIRTSRRVKRVNL